MFLFQLIYGANDQLLKDMRIERNPNKYHFIIQGGDPKVKQSYRIRGVIKDNSKIIFLISQ